MRRRPRLVLDTNVLVSAFLWQGKPGRLIELAGDNMVRLFTSRALMDELADVLHRKKLARHVATTGLAPDQMLANYRRIATMVTARRLALPVSRDAKDDDVLACALAVRADLVVSGDDDLLSLGSHQGIGIVNPAKALEWTDA